MVGIPRRGHGLADDVFAEHRPEGGTAVAAAREPRPPRPLELDVHEPPGRRPVLAQQDGAAIAEHREAAVLVPGVGLCDRSGTDRQVLAREQGRGGLRRDGSEIEAEFVREAVVQDRHPRFLNSGRRSGDVKCCRKTCIAVFESPAKTTRPRDYSIRRTHHLIPESCGQHQLLDHVMACRGSPHPAQ